MAKKESKNLLITDEQVIDAKKQKAVPKQVKRSAKNLKSIDIESIQAKHASIEHLVEALDADDTETDSQTPKLQLVKDDQQEEQAEKILPPIAREISLVPEQEDKGKNEQIRLLEQLPMDPEDHLEEITGEASPRLVSIVESLLFAASKPLSIRAIRKILAETSIQQIQLAVKHILETSQDRGIILSQVAGGFQFRTHPDNAQWVHALLQAKPVRLSRPQLETMAIIAYRQPITRAEIDHVRGVDSGAVLRMLLDRDLIQIVGKKDEPGRPLVYGTTLQFLEFSNLKSLRELPTLREFSELSAESKATLKAKLNPSKTQEDLGQEVIDFAIDEVESGGFS